jgi:hypothetical protein
MSKPLGRREPKDWLHYERYPLTASTLPVKPVPVVLGIGWYSAFDTPERDNSGHWWIGRTGNLGTLRGGHAICCKPRKVTDNTAWWMYYDQGAEGACVGYSCSRAMTLLNRKRYDARWLYHEAQLIDEWPETPPEEGTSVRAGYSILKNQGHMRDGRTHPDPVEGISAYRWARNADEVLDALGYTGLEYVDLLNSWGRSWPHLVRMPANVLEKLIQWDGEAGIPTDR